MGWEVRPSRVTVYSRFEVTTMAEFGRLERVTDIRNGYWPTEDGDFTPWLALPTNMQLLADTLGFDIEVQSTEVAVGPYAADIVGIDPDGNRVVIENQFGKTNHDHLGKLLTYAGSLDSVKTVVWIAERFTEEHRAAVDWLNAVSGEGAAFFAVQLELWRIGTSLAAPKFNLISWPNVAVLAEHVLETGTLSPLKQQQLKYRTAFKQYLDEKSSTVHIQKPRAQHWANAAAGRAGTHLAAVVGTWDEESHKTVAGLNRVELVLDGPMAKQHFASLAEHREEIEGALGTNLIWHNPVNAHMCRIYLKQLVDFPDASAWPTQFAWLEDWMKRFRKVFPGYFDLTPADAESASGPPS